MRGFLLCCPSQPRREQARSHRVMCTQVYTLLAMAPGQVLLSSRQKKTPDKPAVYRGFL